MQRNAFHYLLLLLLGQSFLWSCQKKKDSSNEPAAENSKTEPAAEDSPEAPEEDPTKLIEKPFFYSISGPEGETGYLLGTMHMGVDADKEMPDFVWKGLAASSVLVTEADISDPGLAKGMMLPPDQNLKDMIGEEAFSLLEKELGSGAAKMMMSMHPAAAAATLSMRGLPVTMPMEMSLATKASKSSIGVDYLETAMFQLNLLLEVMNADFLIHMLKNPEVSDSKELLAAYRKGDEAALLKLIMDPSAWGTDGEANLERMLFKRNDDWVPKIKALLKDKKPFIAVGAAHLVGPRGLLASLKAGGYQVERLTK